MVHVNFRWKKWQEPTRWACQSLDFLLQLTPSKFPIIASYLVRVVIHHSNENSNEGNCSKAWVDDACAVWVYNSSVIRSDDATRAADTMVPPKNGGNQSAHKNWYHLQKNSPVPSHSMIHSASAPWDVWGMKMAHIHWWRMPLLCWGRITSGCSVWATRGRTPWSVGKGTLKWGEDGRFHRY